MRRLRALIAELPGVYWTLWLGTLLNRLGGFVVLFLALYLTDVRHVPPTVAGVVVALHGVGRTLAGVAGGILSDRIGPRATMLVSLFGTAAIMVVLAFAGHVWAIAVLVPLVGFLSDLYRPAVAVLVGDMVPPERRVLA